MHITYVTHTRFPTEKAHGHQVAHVCHALTRMGHAVTLVAPTVGNAVRQSAGRYYGLPESFDVRHVPSFDALSSRFVPGSLAFLVSMWSYRRALRRYCVTQKTDMFYVRSPALLSALLQTDVPVILELHALPRYGKRRFAVLCNQCRRIVCLTSLMRRELIAWGVEPARVITEGDGVDHARFQKPVSPKKAKQHWDLPSDRPVIGYVGSLVTFDNVEKGVDVLIGALALLRERGVPVFGWIVGGPPSWVHTYRCAASGKGLTRQDIHFEGVIPSSQVPMALEACDICVYPAPDSSHPYFQRDTSPLKLFEYFASQTPVVCADLPPVRDVADARVVRLVRPGSPASLVSGILDILEHPAEARKRAAAGKAVAAAHSWERRMERIVKGIL